MSGIVTMMSIVRVEGEVMLHDGQSGWVKAFAGMVFPANAKLTIKTGHTGSGDIINTRGELVPLEPNSMLVVCSSGTADDVDTLRHISLNLDEVRRACSIMRQRLAPAV